MEILIGRQFIEEDTINYYKRENKFYEVIDGEETEISELHFSSIVANYWDIDLVENKTSEKLSDGSYKTTKIIPIYDGIEFELYGYGSTGEESLMDVDIQFINYCELYERYLSNLSRNENEFMKSIHKFAFLPKERKHTEIHNKEFHDLEFVAFEDNYLNFRKNAIENGIPKDARADEPIFGYIKDNQLVFFKFFFIKGQFENYIKYIKDNYKKVQDYYKLEKCEVYVSILDYTNPKRDILKDGRYMPEELINKEFEWFIPWKRLEDI